MTNIQSTNGTHKAETPIFVIEDGVPLPPNPRRVSGEPTGISRAIYQLNAGQSFFIPVEGQTELKKTASRVSAAGRTVSQRKKDGRKYAVRTLDGGVRVWRLT